MKQVDLYLWFTSCGWNCLFCKKGSDLIYFPRSDYYNYTTKYEFFHIPSIEKLEEWFNTIDFTIVSRLNISWNDPIEWSGLDEFLRNFRIQYPHIYLILRISNTYILRDSLLCSIDKIEMSLYGHNKKIHECIMDSEGVWEIFHTNLSMIQVFPRIKIQFQTIFLYSNIMHAESIISYLSFLSQDLPVKLVYPHFIPRTMIYELIPKTQYIRLLIQTVSSEKLKKCVLHNFPNISGLRNIFLNIKP